MYYVYFAKSLKNLKVYVGCTSKEPQIRVNEHNTGANKWSKYNGPFELIYFEEYLCKQDAEKRERFYKTELGKRIKYAIIKGLSQ